MTAACLELRRREKQRLADEAQRCNDRVAAEHAETQRQQAAAREAKALAFHGPERAAAATALGVTLVEIDKHFLFEPTSPPGVRCIRCGATAPLSKAGRFPHASSCRFMAEKAAAATP